MSRPMSGGGGGATRCPVVQFQHTTTPSPAYRLRRNIVVALSTVALCFFGACLVYAGIGPLSNDIIVIVGFVLLGTGLAVLLMGISYAVRDRKTRRITRTTDAGVSASVRGTSVTPSLQQDDRK